MEPTDRLYDLESVLTLRRVATLGVLLFVVALVISVGFGSVALPISGAHGPFGGDDGAPVYPAVVDVAGNETVTVEYATGPGEVERFAVDGVDPRLSNAENGWAFVDRSALPPALENASGDPAAGIVTVGRLALVGELSASTREAGDSTVTVVVPAGRDVDPDRKAYFLAEYVSPYSFAPHGTDVTLVAAPDVLPHRGVMYSDDTGYVTVDWFWDGSVGSVWIHEYVHARQDFRTACEMSWFREASAEYFAFRIMQEQHPDVTDDDVRARLESLPEHPETSLANCSSWNGERVDYTRGVRLLYAVDAEIRAESGGEHTLFDVFRAMNELDDPVTIDEFLRLVERYSGEEQTWLESDITEPGKMDCYREYEGTFPEEWECSRDD